MAKVSIVVPVYNCEKYLDQCIDSILAQTYTDLELILVDDGSKDGSGKICDSYALNNENVLVIHQSNSGAAKTRQTGVLTSTGEYLCFVDSDDWLSTDYIERLIKIASEYNTDVVIGGHRHKTEKKELEYKQFLGTGYYSKKDLEHTVYPQMLSATPFYTFGLSPSMWGKLYKRSVVINNLRALDSGIFFGEDGCFVYAVLLDCNSVYITDDTGYIYRYNEASVTHTFKPALMEDNLKLKEYYLNLSKEKNWDISSQLDEYMAFICQCTVISALTASNSVPHRELKNHIKTIYPAQIHKSKKFKQISVKHKVKFSLIRYGFLTILKSLITKQRQK